ncbi:MAG: redoxin domain-containing protein [Saprospiraceae bacterium]
MTRIITLLAFFLLLPVFVFSQKVGFQIKVKIDGFEGKEAYLGYYFGDKQYLRDTAYLAAGGWFYFEGNEKLPGGIYLIVMPPDNQFFQFLVDDDEQWFSMETKLEDTAKGMNVKGSPDNELFYEYLNFLNEKRPAAEDLRQQISEAGDDEKKKSKLQAKLDKIDREVLDYQHELIRQHPKSLTAATIKANMPLDVPEFKGDKKDLQSFYWVRSHWFDNVDMTDARMIRTPFFFQKVDHYVQKMTVQHPDSLNQAIDRVLEMVRPAEESFKFFLIHFLNEYAKSKIVGMDAVYVHIAEKYYATGQAPWTEQEQLEKIVDNANRLEPLLIGKVAPNIQMETQDGQQMWLHDFESPVTVLFFWDPDCSHCKKSMPGMVDFAKKYKGKGVSVFAICTKLVTRDDQGNFSFDEVSKCWSTIKERDMGVFFNTVDPYHRSRYKTVYDIRSTPQIYVLDTDKTILSKRIGVEQLPEVLDHILKAKEEDKNR